MAHRSLALRLDDIIEAGQRVQAIAAERSDAELEADWQAVWLMQRGIEIISEASRHLPVDLKAQHPEIPWRKVADIGNVLRHGYEVVSAPLLAKLAREDLADLLAVCRSERDTIGDDTAL
jgi:uncharacterized protein with HEPN domain